jgi:hypothetical protein
MPDPEPCPCDPCTLDRELREAYQQLVEAADRWLATVGVVPKDGRGRRSALRHSIPDRTEHVEVSLPELAAAYLSDTPEFFAPAVNAPDFIRNDSERLRRIAADLDASRPVSSPAPRDM